MSFSHSRSNPEQNPEVLKIDKIRLEEMGSERIVMRPRSPVSPTRIVPLSLGGWVFALDGEEVDEDRRELGV